MPEIKVQKIIIRGETPPFRASGLKNGYPAWKEISQMVLWTEKELMEFCEIVIDEGFDQNTDHPDGWLMFTRLNHAAA